MMNVVGFYEKTLNFSYYFVVLLKTVYREDIYSDFKTHNPTIILGNRIITDQLNILLLNLAYSI